MAAGELEWNQAWELLDSVLSPPASSARLAESAARICLATFALLGRTLALHLLLVLVLGLHPVCEK